MVILSFIISLLIDEITPVDERYRTKYTPLIVYLLCFAITVMIWELNQFINCKIEKRFSWQKEPLKRLVLQFTLGVTSGIIIIKYSVFYFDKYLCPLPNEISQRLNITAVIVGTLFTVILIAINIGFELFANWRESLVEAEKYKKESIEAQLQNLKSQVNPHFLFNNLSVLSSLVYKNQDKAVDFINQFSKVYRYILENQTKELIELESELKFIESYCYLLKIRFEAGFNYQILVDNKLYGKLVPPMVLQLLIENTIKHNQTSIDKPLVVEVLANEHFISVKNKLQLRTVKEESSKTGLTNIISRYKFFTKKEVEIIQNSKFFEVKIPLL
jgi:LytS/YehU family sensor histidine kinase